MSYFTDERNIEQMPIDDRMDTEFTLYVNNLPLELNEDAIRQIFSEYGKITSMFYPRNASWTYITYGTYREAESAIRELDNKKPLYLKVALARQSMKQELQTLHVSETCREEPSVERATMSTEFTHNNTKPQQVSQTIDRSRLLQIIRKPQTSAEIGSSSSTFSQACNTCEIEEPYANTNRLWTRGVITVTADGKRRVSLGRGYTFYELPEEDPKLEEYITKVHEQRQNGLYECATDKLKDGVSKCLICSSETVKHCEKCYTYYCSKTCQVKDWPRHQAECQRIPALVEDTVNDSSLLEIKKETKTTVPSAINKTITSNDMKLRRPNIMQAENLNNTNNMHKKNNEDFMYQRSASNSTINEDRYSSPQHDDCANVSQTKREDQFGTNTMDTKDTVQNRFRRYTNTNENTYTDQKRNDGYVASNITNQSNYNCNYSNGAIKKTSPSKAIPNKERFDNGNARGRSYNNDRNQSYQRNGYQNDRKSNFYNDKENADRQQNSTSSNNIGIDDHFAFQEDTSYLSKTEFTEVEIVTLLGNDEYGIYKLKDSNARVYLLKKLKDVAEKSRNMQPVIGNIYGVQRGALWCRAVVKSLNPVKVNFIDFGNDEILNRGADIKDIHDMAKVPKFVRKIRLMQGTNEKYKNLPCGERIFVKMLSMDADKTIVVKVQEQSESLSPCTMKNAPSVNNAVVKFMPECQEKQKTLPKNSLIQIPSVFDTLANLLAQQNNTELRIVGIVEIHEIMQKNLYSATLGPQICSNEVNILFNELIENCNSMQEAVNYKPEDLICGRSTESGWQRGYVSVCPMTSSGLHIFAIDEARITSVDKIMPCPMEYVNTCSLGVTCESTIDLQVGVYQIEAVMTKHNYEQQSLNVKMTGDSLSGTVTAVLRHWKYSKNLIRALPELKNGSKICLTSYQNQSNMFARSLEETEIEYYNNIMQRVALSARTAPRLSKSPRIGQLVIAPFCDGNSYRALILEILQNDKAKVVYIDFGNVEEIDVKEFQVLPDYLAIQRSCSAKIYLKSVCRDVPMNKDVDLYLRNLMGKEIALICVFEGASFKDGVHLKMPNGESINDNINKFLIPDWKKADYDDKTCYMLNDIAIANLGSEGDIVTALLLVLPLNKEENGMRYMMIPDDIDLMTHVFETLPSLLKEYCDQAEYYIPRAEELCIVLYEEEWYRAVCLIPKESNTTSKIFFIDWGNIEIVEHKNIRLMPKDFIVPEALANMCTVVNLAPVDREGNYSPAVQKRLAELITGDSKMKIKIVNRCGDGDYKIELPDIRAALMKEGLV